MKDPNEVTDTYDDNKDYGDKLDDGFFMIFLDDEEEYQEDYIKDIF